jgi:hypothetical protein
MPGKALRRKFCAKVVIMEMRNVAQNALCHGLAPAQHEQLQPGVSADFVGDTGDTAQPPQAASGIDPVNFANKVHTWNPKLALWRRSLKE